MKKGGVVLRLLIVTLVCLMLASTFGGLTETAQAANAPVVETRPVISVLETGDDFVNAEFAGQTGRSGITLSAASLKTCIPQLQASGAVVLYDAKQSPIQPVNRSPANEAMGVILTPTLRSSPFYDPDSGDNHTASQWQIRAISGNYTQPVFDSGIDHANLTSITISAGILDYAKTYCWRVRYQDNRGFWSEWSAETSFTTLLTTEGILKVKALGTGAQPLSGMFVMTVPYVWGRYGYTDLSGFFDMAAPAGNYTIVTTYDGGANKPGYCLTKNATIIACEVTQVVMDIEHDPEVTIGYEVKAYDGTALSNASIKMHPLGTGYTPPAGYTNPAGQETVLLTKGTYNVFVHGSNHLYVLRDMSLTSDKVLNINPAEISYPLSSLEMHFYSGNWTEVTGSLRVWPEGWDVWSLSSETVAHITPGVYQVGPLFIYRDWDYLYSRNLDISGAGILYKAGGPVILSDSARTDGSSVAIQLTVYDSFGNTLEAIGGPNGWESGRPRIEVFYPNGSLLASDNFSSWELRSTWFNGVLPSSAPSGAYTYIIYVDTGPYQGVVSKTGVLNVANQPPNQPTNVSPGHGATLVTLVPRLQSSVFSDPQPGYTHTASQWQIRLASGSYSSPVFDSGTDTANLTSITVPAGILSYVTTYYWHVRYKDSRGTWSDWSAETSFTTSVITYTLTMATTGNGATSPMAGAHSYLAGTSVNITAFPTTGWYFSHWSGDMLGNPNPASITMNSDKTLRANFAPTGVTLVESIRLSPGLHESRWVRISGTFRGWEAGHGSSPVNRSDWIIADGTGSIYVSGRSLGLKHPGDIGKPVTVTGIVRLRSGQPYIEVKSPVTRR